MKRPLTSFGETTSDASFPAGNAIQRLLINDPAPITTIEAQVTVTEAEVQNCAANTSTGRSRAGIHASLFNDGSSTGAGDPTGDIRARIEKRRDSAGANTIRASIFRCGSAGCGTSATLTSFTFVTSWVFRVADTLRLEWDAAGDQVLFTVNGVENAALSYVGVSDANPPGSDFRQLEVRNDPENCTAGQRRASMTARFDNVMVNP